MKRKLAIYPFFEELIPLLQYKNKIKDYEITYAITPKGWETFDNIDINLESIYTEEKFLAEKLIASVDAFLLCRPIFQVEKSLYDNVINLAIKHNKQIIHVPDIKSIFDGLSIKPICLQPEKKYITQNSELATIDVPVAMILGFGENCEKWNIQLGMYDYFTKNGYKISLISSNPLSELMGFQTMPSGIDNVEASFTQKVKQVNDFVKGIELNENPDMIIIGIPGGILRYNQSITNDYGYLPYLICNAVIPDISILNLYCGEYTEKYIEEIKSVCFYRFGVVVNYFHISKKVCNYNFETKKLDYFSVENKFLIDNILKPQVGIPVFSINDASSSEKIFQKIMTELQNNVAAV